ncbi:hypothetical protein SEA_SPOOKY_105 [Gordonia phage Spooky]|nr:hypothetical protein SEA_SPOOKY_105 [Gordonia phage Spooky]
MSDNTTTCYLMWFTRFGLSHLEIHFHLDDCYDLELMLDDCDTHIFDQYGILDQVEECTDTGSRIIPDDEWETGMEAYRKRRDAEAAARRAKNPPPKPYGHISIRTPGSGRTVASGWEQLTTCSTEDEFNRVRDLWTARLGASRVQAIKTA